MMSMQMHSRAKRWSFAGTVWPVEQIRPNFRGESDLSPSGATFATPAEQLEVGTVAKALQMLSGELRPSRLIETLMRLALEHAGAERGTLVLLRDDELCVEAQAMAAEQSIEVTLRQVAVTP